MPDDGRRYEIIDGDLTVSPTPILWHQKLVVWLCLLLARWVETGAGGEVYVAPATVILTEDCVVEPDLFWIAPARVCALVADVVHGAPDLVVEVLSPSTSRRDRAVKARIYAKHGVREYWLVDPDSQTVTILARRKRDFRVHVSGSGDRPLGSSLDAGLTVVPREIFRR